MAETNEAVIRSFAATPENSEKLNDLARRLYGDRWARMRSAVVNRLIEAARIEGDEMVADEREAPHD